MRTDSARIAALESQLNALKLQLRGSPGVSTAGAGAISIRTMQLGFAAELTSTWDATTGYDWKRLKLEPPDYVDPSVQLTGNQAFAIPNNEDLDVGTQVWLEPSPDAVGWIISGGGTNTIAIEALTDVAFDTGTCTLTKTYTTFTITGTNISVVES